MMRGFAKAWTVACLFVAGVLSSPTPASAGNGVYDYTLPAIEGGPLPLSQFEGQPILLVNTASFCGFTHQYEQLQSLWDGYRERGLVVVGIPSNDFGAQEPGSAEDIQHFCEVNFAITFPMSDKIVVKGADAHPLFHHISEVLGQQAAPRWNFHKYLVDRQGQLVETWPSHIRPDHKQVLARIEQVLQDG